MPDDNSEESLISHLEALRETLLRCIISLCVVLPFSLWLAPKFLNWLIDIIAGDSSVSFNFFSPMEVFLIQLKTALVLDVVICFPYIAKKLWDFILPALYEHEKNLIKGRVRVSAGLFALGFAFCRLVLMPLVVKFGMIFSTSNLNPVFGLSNIIGLSLVMALAFGVMFQMPLITVALIKSGIVPYDTVSNLRPYIIVVILILAAIFTPPDVVSQLMLGIPTYLLFEAGLFFAKHAAAGGKAGKKLD